MATSPTLPIVASIASGRYQAQNRALAGSGSANCRKVFSAPKVTGALMSSATIGSSQTSRSIEARRAATTTTDAPKTTHR